MQEVRRNSLVYVRTTNNRVVAEGRYTDNLREEKEVDMNEKKTIEDLKRIFDSLGRGTSCRLIIETHEESKMREIIESLFSDELAKEL